MKKLFIIAIAILVSTQLFAQKKHYKVKNFTIDYEMEVMGMKTLTSMFVKNYGETEVAEVKMNVFGNEVHTRALSDGEFMYQLDMVNKTGEKTPISEYENRDKAKELDYENLTKEVKDEYKIKELGTETILGKSCKIIEMEVTGNKVKVWVWKNIALKTEMSQMGMTVVMKATKLDTNPSFPAGIFKVPAGFDIK